MHSLTRKHPVINFQELQVRKPTQNLLGISCFLRLKAHKRGRAHEHYQDYVMRCDAMQQHHERHDEISIIWQPQPL